MADSVYDQSLDIAARQIKTIIDGSNKLLLPESSLEPRDFDWNDINSYPGFSLRYVSDAAMLAQVVEDTNTSSNAGYPIIVIANFSSGSQRDQRHREVRSIMETIRRYYHHRRRFQDVDVEGVLENACTVRVGGPTPPQGIKVNKHVEILTIIGWFMESRILGV